MHTFFIRQGTPDGILSCALTHIIQSQHAMPSTDKLRGSWVESRSYHASADSKPLLSSFAFLSLSLPQFFFPSAVHRAYLQVSAGVAGRLPSRHLTAALLPRTAHSFPGFVQSTTALLVLLCHQAPSAPHRSLSTPVWEGGLSVHVCLCVCVWGKEKGRGRGRVVERGDGKDVNICALDLECSTPLTFIQRMDLLSQDLSFIIICVFMHMYVYHMAPCR